MPTLDELRQQVAAEEQRLVDEQAERHRLESRLAELRSHRAPEPNGVALPPTNQADAMLAGDEADLARWRRLVHRDEFGEQIDVTSREAGRAFKAMVEDAVRRHARNLQNGRGDLGQSEASFFRQRR